MKAISTTLIFCIISFFALGQHPLVGTWEMVSIKGIDADGQKFFNDTSTVREVKIITATHYMLIAEDVEGDSLVFNRCYAGAVEIKGNKYNEIPMLSSSPIFENVRTDYTWSVVGDRFTQSGVLVRPDGKKVILEELIFQRVKPKHAYRHNSTHGMWKLLSSKYTTPDGISHDDTNETVTGLQLITPTHWMYISSRNKKFEHAMGGAYSMNGGKYYLNLDYASFPKRLWGKTEMTTKVEGDKLRINGTSVFNDGKKFTWEDLFERAK